MKKIILFIAFSLFLNADMIDNIKSSLNTGITYTKEKAEIAPIQAKIISLEIDIDRAYKIIGKKYVEYIKTDKETKMDVEILMEQLEPLIQEKADLEEEILKKEKKYQPTRDINNEMDRLENK